MLHEFCYAVVRLQTNSILYFENKMCLIFKIRSFVQTIEDFEDSHSISYIKLINVGQKVITRNCHGYLPSQVAFYLQNVHISPRKIYLSVNAEAINISDLVGGKLVVCISNWNMPFPHSSACTKFFPFAFLVFCTSLYCLFRHAVRHVDLGGSAVQPQLGGIFVHRAENRFGRLRQRDARAHRYASRV